MMWHGVLQTVYLCGFTLADNIPLSTALILVSKLTVVTMMLVFVRKHIVLRLTLLFAIPSALTSLLGVELLMWMSSISLRKLLGIMFFLSFASLWVRKKWGCQEWNRHSNALSVELLLRK